MTSSGAPTAAPAPRPETARGECAERVRSAVTHGATLTLHVEIEIPIAITSTTGES